ncbi:hypothetical protein [Gordonia polyisoprenivorans]|uniref:hypothetical protein n=1 Tax=Gordonia polyisoprenivorans TaxID=84595 RepID=UPI0020128A48|nr:hypothetical protein [Gordonia polyisoprenivorans]
MPNTVSTPCATSPSTSTSAVVRGVGIGCRVSVIGWLLGAVMVIGGVLPLEP